MKQHDPWKDAFPQDEAVIAARYLVRVWDEIVKKQPKYFKFSVREPKLTERLCGYLQNLQADSSLTGKWTYEDPQVAYNEDGTLLYRIRKDITYFSNYSGKRLFLVFEFKKIARTKSSIDKYFGSDGVARFVEGNYSIGQPVAVMVGIVGSESDVVVKSLTDRFFCQTTQHKLKMLQEDGENYLAIPSRVFPSVAIFDTKHERSSEKAPLSGAISLAHVIIGFGNN
ncbi:MAG: hypothetical protein JW915_10455 [Chitinispirillaceae bacterium]|nr:hypothetical protein [Chitinispirillaceae bacterium]